MKVVNLSQRSPEWLAWRSQGVTASEAAAIVGRSPYKTLWRLWAEKTGLCEPDDLSANPFVQRGLQCEDQVRRGPCGRSRSNARFIAWTRSGLPQSRRSTPC